MEGTYVEGPVWRDHVWRSSCRGIMYGQARVEAALWRALCGEARVEGTCMEDTRVEGACVEGSCVEGPTWKAPCGGARVEGTCVEGPVWRGSCVEGAMCWDPCGGRHVEGPAWRRPVWRAPVWTTTLCQRPDCSLPPPFHSPSPSPISGVQKRGLKAAWMRVKATDPNGHSFPEP